MRCSAWYCIAWCQRLPRPQPHDTATLRTYRAVHLAWFHHAAATGLQPDDPEPGQTRKHHADAAVVTDNLMSTQNKYLADRAAPDNGCSDRGMLVVSSDPALLATLHWMADDHFVGPKLEAALSELLHEAELM